jgi:hypothetical protein
MAYTVTTNVNPVATWKVKVDAALPELYPFVDQFLGYGQPLTLAAYSPDGGTLSYKWYWADTKTNANATSGYLIAGATSASLPSSLFAGKNYFWVEVTNTNNNVTGVKTAVIKSPAVFIQRLSLRQRIADAHLRTATITIYEDESVEGLFDGNVSDINGLGTNITLECDGGAKTISLNKNGIMFCVRNGATLTIKDGINLVGLETNNLQMVLVYDSGSVFTMDGGSITHNFASTWYGGGVCINSGSTFIMNAGTISNNKSVNNEGGGVNVRDSTFTMNGGTISGNTAISGGGVAVINANFTMNSGAVISGNTVTAAGGGVRTNGGTFTMNSGAVISGNTAYVSSTSDCQGGGIYLQGSVFNMNGGEIHSNRANSGGGIYSYAGAMNKYNTGGIIRGNDSDTAIRNTASYSGAAVCSWKLSKWHNKEILGNVAFTFDGNSNISGGITWD